jgi:hypothetical protein
VVATDVVDVLDGAAVGVDGATDAVVVSGTVVATARVVETVT